MNILATAPSSPYVQVAEGTFTKANSRLSLVDGTAFFDCGAFVPDTNLVGYWPFNETSGTNAPDLSGNGNDGTLVNSPDWVDGVVGKCLDFGGTDEYVFVADDASLNFGTGDFSISL